MTTAAWTGPSGAQAWTTGTNWSSTPDYPSGIGAGAIFSGPDAVRTVNATSAITVGSISIDNNTAFNTTLANGGGSLTWDAVDAGPTTVTVDGTGTGKLTISATSTFVDDVVATVNQTSAASSTGGLEWTGAVAIASTGGFTKQGGGLMTLSTGAKNYPGPTLFDTNSGRTRISQVGRPTQTSSMTVRSGAQLELISAGTYTFGPGPLNLNGTGIAAFPGVIRPTTNLAISIANAVDLQSDSLIHVQGSATGALTLTDGVSGSGRLFVGSIPHDANLGQLILSGTNSYTGGTTVQAGTLVAGGTSMTALGTGNVAVDSANLVFGGSAAKLLIQTGSANAIADSATLSLAGGNAALTADDGFIELDGGVNETVGGLVLGGATQTMLGTYGSTASTAMFQFDEYFAGAGVITLAAAGVLGDYNNNGVVDAADYALWRDGGPLQNDPTPGVSAADYDFWRSRFGATSGSSSGLAAVVPEPATLTLGGVLLPLLAIGRWSRRQPAVCRTKFSGGIA